MNIGDFRHKIIIKSCDNNVDEYGTILKQYTPKYKTFAKIETLNSKVYNTGEQNYYKIFYKFYIRYNKDYKILMTDLIEYNGRNFKITVPPYNVDEKKHCILLQCEELV